MHFGRSSLELKSPKNTLSFSTLPKEEKNDSTQVLRWIVILNLASPNIPFFNLLTYSQPTLKPHAIEWNKNKINDLGYLPRSTLLNVVA